MTIGRSTHRALAVLGIGCACSGITGGVIGAAAWARAEDAGRSRDDATAAEQGVPAVDALAQQHSTQLGSKPNWAPKLRATVKPALAHVGDPIEVTLEVTHRQGVTLTLPLRLDLGDFSELSRRESQRTERTEKTEGAEKTESTEKYEKSLPHVVDTFVVRLAAYKLGKLTIPPIPVNALGPGGELYTVKTSPFPVHITSVMANEPQPKPKQTEAPVRVFRRTYLPLYVGAALLALVLVVLVTLFLQRRLQKRRQAEKPPPPPIPAHVIALERLDQLDPKALIREHNDKQLYLELSEIMREYIGRIWHVDALEMTTGEIAYALHARRISAARTERLEHLFGEWDLVKFAKLHPDEASACAAVDSARAFVYETKDEAGATGTMAESRPQPELGR